MLKRYIPWVAALPLIAIAALMFGCGQEAGSTASKTTSSDGLDRTVLPIKEPARQTYKELDARNAKAPARWEVKATVPCGVVLTSPPTSLTVAVQVVTWPGLTEAGEHDVIVAVGRSVTGTNADPPATVCVE